MKANRKFLKHMTGRDDAVSPVIAVILMVAITVVLAATVYVWVSGFGGNQQKIINTQLSAVGGGGTSAGQIILKHVSGDTISGGNWKVSITSAGSSSAFCASTSGNDLSAGSQYVFAASSSACAGTSPIGTTSPSGTLTKGTVYQVKVLETTTNTVLLDREITA